MRKKLFIIAASLVLTTLVANPCFAQDEEVIELDQIEAEIERNRVKSTQQADVKDVEEKATDFSTLGRLAPFSEISVIQKRFLPKTGRFQFFGGLSTVTNNPWFMGVGFNGKLGYHFNEKFGVELSFLTLSSSERQAVKDLFQQQDVQTNAIISTKGYYGAEFVWTPIYGKLSLTDKRIIPFDMYFAAGAGTTNVENGEGGATLHLGVGQIFALTKATGFRWDFAWNSFSATPVGQQQQSFNELLLTFGLSFFFPEAGYR